MTACTHWFGFNETGTCSIEQLSFKVSSQGDILLLWLLYSRLHTRRNSVNIEKSKYNEIYSGACAQRPLEVKDTLIDNKTMKLQEYAKK